MLGALDASRRLHDDIAAAVTPLLAPVATA